MKTLSRLRSLIDHGIHPSIEREILPREIQQNRNAQQTTKAEAERDACEEELYRLRFGIENLLANGEHGNLPFSRSGKSSMFRSDRLNLGWFDRCSRCCRRRRKTPTIDHHEISPHGSPSPSPSLSFSSPQKNSGTKSGLKSTIDSLVRSNQSPAFGNLFTSSEISDPANHPLIMKILEMKALDCLCADYSKQNTQMEIEQALAQMAERSGRSPSDSGSVVSSAGSFGSGQSSVSPSTRSELSAGITPEGPKSDVLLSPSPTPSSRRMKKPSRSKSKSSSKSKRPSKSPGKKSKVKIVNDSKSRSKGKPSPSKSRSRSKTPSKRSTASKKKGRTPSKSKASSSRQSSSRRKKSKNSSKSQTKAKTKSKRRKGKSKSRNENSNDRHSDEILQLLLAGNSEGEILVDGTRKI